MLAVETLCETEMGGPLNHPFSIKTWTMLCKSEVNTDMIKSLHRYGIFNKTKQGVLQGILSFLTQCFKLDETGLKLLIASELHHWKIYPNTITLQLNLTELQVKT